MVMLPPWTGVICTYGANMGITGMGKRTISLLIQSNFWTGLKVQFSRQYLISATREYLLIHVNQPVHPD